jgi:hypothetical protein
VKAQTWDKWLRAVAREGRHVTWPPEMLGALTGQDSRALGAIHCCWELYACGDAAGQRAALESVKWLLRAMLPHNRYLARELIAMSMNWDDRGRLWALVSGDA